MKEPPKPLRRVNINHTNTRSGMQLRSHCFVSLQPWYLGQFKPRCIHDCPQVKEVIPRAARRCHGCVRHVKSQLQVKRPKWHTHPGKPVLQSTDVPMSPTAKALMEACSCEHRNPYASASPIQTACGPPETHHGSLAYYLLPLAAAPLFRSILNHNARSTRNRSTVTSSFDHFSFCVLI